MIIVKRRAELVRFGLFLLLIGLMTFFVSSRLEAWRLSMQASVELPVQGPILTDPDPHLPGPATREPQAVSDFFADYRMEREQNRSALRETLREVMDHESIDPEARKRASLQYIRAGEIAAMENQAESMLRAKGFTEVAVFLTEGAAQVVVQAHDLTQQQYLQVVDLVSRVTSVKASAVQVIPRRM
jgi:stage III sporulation protein AH